MRKFIIRTFIFLAFMFVVDRMVGTVLNYLSLHPKGGMTLHRNYLTNHTTEDVLVMGSSRARYHYAPKVVTDVTGLSCFNCGEDGNGILLFYAWWKLITKHYHPQLVIYEVTPQYDILAGDNYKFLWRLRRVYDDQEEIKTLFDDVDHVEKWKMLCQMYRYNSTFTELAADFVYPLEHNPADGYVPRKEIIRPGTGYGKPRFSFDLKYDSLKLSYMEKLAREKGSSKLVFVASPIYDGMNPEALKPVLEISKKYDVPFYDYSNDPGFVRNDQYFRDTNHLNATGAEAFTRCLMEKLIEDGYVRKRGES